MGFNPFRGAPSERRLADILMVAGAVALTLAVVLWAIFG